MIFDHLLSTFLSLLTLREDSFLAMVQHGLYIHPNHWLVRFEHFYNKIYFNISNFVVFDQLFSSFLSLFHRGEVILPKNGSALTVLDYTTYISILTTHWWGLSTSTIQFTSILAMLWSALTVLDLYKLYIHPNYSLVRFKHIHSFFYKKLL